MKKLLALLLCLPMAAWADAYYSFDGTNDRMVGSFTSTYADPMTIGFWLRYADHPTATDVIVNIGNANNSQSNSYICRFGATDNTFQATASDSGGSVSSATATKSADNTWIPVLCEYIADNSRAVFASDQTATNATSRAVSDAIQFISFGENLAGGSGAEIDLAYVSIWDVQLSDPNEASFLGGSCPSGIDASNLIGYWDLQTNSGTQTNAGVDAGGDLTVTGATYSATGGPGVSCATEPTFSVAPSCSATTDGVSCTYTASAASTAYGVCVAPADGTPSAAQIIAGNNDGGTAAIMAGSDANSGGADTIVVTGTHPIPKVDCHFVLSNGDGNSSVDSSQTDKLRSPRSGYAIVTMAAATNICDLDADFDPDCATGDVFEYETATNENAGCAVAIGTDGDVTLTPGSAGDCDGLRTFEYCPEDVSNTTTGLFTAPACDFDTDDTAYINDSPPSCSISVTQLVLYEDEAMTPVDLEVLGDCQDPDGDTLSYAVTSGTLPNGTALSGTGNRDWTGTPDTENEAGEALTVTVTDPAGESTTYEFTAFVVDPVGAFTMPDCDSLTASECEDLVVEAAPWREEDPGLIVGGFVCGTGQPFLTIADTDPDAGVATEPFAAITVYLVGAVIPDLTGMTAADAIAAIEALCP